VITAFVIFLITYLFIGLRRIPRVHIDRPAGALVGAVLMIVCGVLTARGEEAVAAGSLVRPTLATVVPADRSHFRTFRIVLVCNTPETRMNGLQGFRPLGPDEAALFLFDKPETVTFWMGSVAYPIDIIFIGPDKKVIRVYRNVEPGSHDLYPSVKRARWAVETAAGAGLKTGDRVNIE
jgi:hypothetical protein